MFTTLATLIALILHISEASPTFDCRWKTENATYDLCHLQLSTTTEELDGKTFYEVYDDRGSFFFNFTYIFNVANNIESRPPDDICWNNTLRKAKYLPTGYCLASNIIETDGECLEFTDISSNTAAYQVHRGMNREETIHDCFRLHDGETPPIWSHIDPKDPSIGVKLTYTNGDWCDAAEKNREFSLEFYCSERVENIPDKKEEIISEDSICSYVLEIESAYGCPAQCPIHSNKLCGGHGICEFDYFNSMYVCSIHNSICIHTDTQCIGLSVTATMDIAVLIAVLVALNANQVIIYCLMYLHQMMMKAACFHCKIHLELLPIMICRFLI